MNFLDILLIMIVSGMLIIGAYSGSCKQLSTPLAFVISYILSLLLKNPLGEKMADWFATSAIAATAADALVFAISFIVVKVVWNLITGKLVNNSTLSAANRIFGAGLGALKGLIIGGGLVLLVGHLGKKNLREESFCARNLHHGYEWFCETGFYIRSKNEIAAALSANDDHDFTTRVKNIFNGKK